MDRSFWKTVLATTLGALIAAAIVYGVCLLLAPAGMHPRELMGQMNRSIPAKPVAVTPAKSQESRPPAATAPSQPSVVVLAAPASAATGTVSGAGEAAFTDARKEAAWQKYYKRSPLCDKPDGSGFVECANQHIRARRNFESLYAAGKL